jgi:hypothetical protein
LLGTSSAKVNGLATSASSVSATEVQVYVPSNATSGPVTVITNHGSVTSSASLTILADSDGDGMSDQFEQQYFGSATGGDPNADDDGDGVSNVDEFRAGTNPKDVKSVLRVTQIRRQGNDIVVTFPSVADKRYRLEAGATLTDGFPINVATTPAAAANPARNVTDVNGATQPKRFYRIKVLL